MQTLKEVNKRKRYTLEQLKKKYAGKFIEIYPYHQDYWNEKAHAYETVYEVPGVSSVIKENHNKY